MKKFIKEWFIPVGIPIIVVLLIHRFWFFFIGVPTGSMIPTINEGDKLLVTRVYNPENLKRGDIVEFNHKETNQLFIKRLIGLPGDKIEIKEDGSVYINGEKLDEPYVKKPGGISGTTYKVPAGRYFFLGDNRLESWDARSWENSYISSEDIIGKAHYTVYPFSRFGKLK